MENWQASALLQEYIEVLREWESGVRGRVVVKRGWKRGSMRGLIPMEYCVSEFDHECNKSFNLYYATSHQTSST